MSPKERRLLEFLNQLNDLDIPKQLEEYHEILDTLIYLHETLAELKIGFKHWEVYSDTLMTKFYLHAISLHKILSGDNIKSKYYTQIIEHKIIDTSSSSVILRSLLETFLMYHHIYVNPDNDSQKELRLTAWICAGLVSRKDFPTKSEDSKKQKEKDRLEIERMKEAIKNLDAFKKLTIAQQEQLIIKGNGKLFKHWSVILEETGILKGSGIYNMYNILSSYAHSEGLSIIQIKSNNVLYSSNVGLINQHQLIAKILTCRLILIIKEKYSDVKLKYNLLPEALQDRIEIYSKLFYSIK